MLVVIIHVYRILQMSVIINITIIFVIIIPYTSLFDLATNSNNFFSTLNLFEPLVIYKYDINNCMWIKKYIRYVLVNGNK
jgi:hypothetical protein